MIEVKEIDGRFYTISGLAVHCNSLESVKLLIRNNFTTIEHLACKYKNGSWESISGMSIRENKKDILKFHLETLKTTKSKHIVRCEGNDSYNGLGYAIHLKSEDMINFFIFDLGFDFAETVKRSELLTLRSLNSNTKFESCNITNIQYNAIGTALSSFKDDPSSINIENIKLLLRLGASNLEIVASGILNNRSISLSLLVFIILPAINTQNFFGAADRPSSSV